MERAGALERELESVKKSLKKCLAEKKLLGSNVGRLEKDLAYRKRQNSKLRGELEDMKGGSVSLLWRIEGFTEKAKCRRTLKSKVFAVKTAVGEYQLHLNVIFFRGGEGDQSERGYMGLFLGHDMGDGGVKNFPVILKGSMLSVVRMGSVGKAERRVDGKYDDTAKLNFNSDWGWPKLLGTDKICPISLTGKDRVAPAGLRNEPVWDASDLLVDDTLSVKGVIRITPCDFKIQVEL
eukprot:3939174-Rhodomonas_salina.2